MPSNNPIDYYKVIIHTMSESKESTDGTVTYKVPRLLWENLEALLLAEGKRYVRDIAKTLKVPEKELLKRVFPTKDTLQIILHDTHTQTLECSAHVISSPKDERVGQVGRRCRRPVQLGSEFCSVHVLHRSLFIQSTPVRKLQDSPSRPSLWVLENGTVINEEGIEQGLFSEETGKLTLFVE